MTHQGIFLTEGLNLAFPHCRQIPYCLSHQGSPKGGMQITKWEEPFLGVGEAVVRIGSNHYVSIMLCLSGRHLLTSIKYCMIY